MSHDLLQRRRAIRHNFPLVGQRVDYHVIGDREAAQEQLRAMLTTTARGLLL